MNRVLKSAWLRTAVVGSTALLLATGIVWAQDDPPAYSPEQLDQIVSRIALYPDPLLAQVLAAATYSDQISDAAAWANANRGLNGSDLADAIADANLPFDPSVQALLPFPTVLDMMASDLNWTYTLGNAVLSQRPDVMDAVQRMRQAAANYGYLRDNPDMRVVYSDGGIEILPVQPEVIYVPVYDPMIVYAPPPPGIYVGAVIRFPFHCMIGGVFGSWGWGGRMYWGSRTLVVNNVVWNRTWVNRGSYVHNYGNWDYGRWRNSPLRRSHPDNDGVRINTFRVAPPPPAANRTPDRYAERDFGRRPQNAPVFQAPAYNPPRVEQPRPAPRPTFDRPAPAPQRPVMQAPPQRQPERRVEPARTYTPAPRGGSNSGGGNESRSPRGRR